MSFETSFDPFRALGAAWKILWRGPLTLLVGGIAYLLLTGDDLYTSGVEWDAESGPRVDWEDLPWLLFASFASALACLFGLVLFVGACLVGLTLPRAIRRVVREGRDQVSDLLSPDGALLRMILTQILLYAVFVAGAFPILLLLVAGVAAGGALDMPGLGGAVAVLGALLLLPVWLYVYLGVRLAEQAVALEDMEPVAALKRSWSLVDGNRLRLLVFLFVLSVVEALGVLLCCVGWFLTGTLKLVALNESYLRLVTPPEERAGWWLEQSEIAA